MKGVIQRTWPYGTTKTVRVLDVNSTVAGLQVVCCYEQATGEGFLLLRRCKEQKPRPNEEREIIFIEGGPTGGYWHMVTLHRCPPPGEGNMPCCGRTPFEISMFDRMSIDGPINCRRLEPEVSV